MLNNLDIKLSKNQWVTVPQKHFGNATDGQLATQKTIVRLKYDEVFLYVEFECHDNPFGHQNTYTAHNSDMWNQEVFELFISDELEDTKHYLEFEINPNNAIWTGQIYNPTGNSPESAKMIDYQQTGIEHWSKTETNVWSGFFKIPFSLVGKKQKEYRLNFYRIISTKSHSEPNWAGNADDCLYLCWRPTMSGSAPAFHRPAAFGRLVLG